MSECQRLILTWDKQEIHYSNFANLKSAGKTTTKHHRIHVCPPPQWTNTKQAVNSPRSSCCEASGALRTSSFSTRVEWEWASLAADLYVRDEGEAGLTLPSSFLSWVLVRLWSYQHRHAIWACGQQVWKQAAHTQTTKMAKSTHQSEIIDPPVCLTPLLYHSLSLPFPSSLSSCRFLYNFNPFLHQLPSPFSLLYQVRSIRIKKCCMSVWSTRSNPHVRLG